VPRLETEYALYRFCAITHLSWTQVHFLFIIEDKVFYLTLNGKHALLVPSRLHCCHNSCFASFLFADFTQCPCVALLQGNPGFYIEHKQSRFQFKTTSQLAAYVKKFKGRLQSLHICTREERTKELN